MQLVQIVREQHVINVELLLLVLLIQVVQDGDLYAQASKTM